MKIGLAAINEFIASRITLAMGTMWCVYCFFVWGLIPLIFPPAQDVVFYVSGGIIQLVALPLIMVGQSILNRSSESRAAHDHEMLMEQLEIIKQVSVENAKEFEAIKQVSVENSKEFAAINKVLDDNQHIISLLESMKK